MAEQKLHITTAGDSYTLPAEEAMAAPYQDLSFRQALLQLAREYVKDADLADLISDSQSVFEQNRQDQAPNQVPVSPATNWGEFMAQFRDQQEKDVHVGVAKRFTGGRAQAGVRA